MSTPAGLLLTPGAGANRESPALVAVEQALADVEPPLAVRRVDFPYRIAGRRMPDRAPVAVEHLRGEATAWAEQLGVPTDRLLLGGRSYGGRMCSMAVAEGLLAAGLVLLSYPLHPPGRPEKLRVEHFGRITVPTLFVSGDKDPFGTPDELAEQIAAIPGPVTTITLPGAHDMRGETRQSQVAQAVKTWITTL